MSPSSPAPCNSAHVALLASVPAIGSAGISTITSGRVTRTFSFMESHTLQGGEGTTGATGGTGGTGPAKGAAVTGEPVTGARVMGAAVTGAPVAMGPAVTGAPVAAHPQGLEARATTKGQFSSSMKPLRPALSKTLHNTGSSSVGAVIFTSGRVILKPSCPQILHSG